jgi:alginate O-acetyltransferase complex protein AlgI
MVTMLLGGLWHGANWTFVVWGGIHGAGLAIERLIVGKSQIQSSQAFLARWGRRILIFNLVCLGWVFFRSPSVGGALELLAGISVWQWLPVYGVAIQFLAVHALALFLIDLQIEKSGAEYVLGNRAFGYRVVAGTVLCALTTLLGANQTNAFIYFQF